MKVRADSSGYSLDAPRLRVVQGGRAAKAAGPNLYAEETHHVPRRRPGERREPFRLVVTDPLRELAAEAAAAGLRLPEAAALAIEARLLLDDLAHGGTPTGLVTALLNRAAASERVDLPVAGSFGDYIRHLSARRPVAAQLPEHRTVEVPVALRLLARAVQLPRAAPFAPVRFNDLIDWEVAAAISGRTLSEWGYLTVLRASRAQAV